MMGLAAVAVLAVLAGTISIDGKSVRVTVEPDVGSPSDQEGAPRGNPRPPPALPPLVDATVGSVLRAGGETLVRTWRHSPNAKRSELFRIRDGVVRRWELPVNDRWSRDVVCGRRWLVVALEFSGTLVWDLTTDRAVGFLEQVGQFGNAPPGPPACSPDGRFVALATPYGRAVTVVRLADASVVGAVDVEAPGRVRWTRRGIFVRRRVLPYER